MNTGYHRGIVCTDYTGIGFCGVSRGGRWGVGGRGGGGGSRTKVITGYNRGIVVQVTPVPDSVGLL